MGHLEILRDVPSRAEGATRTVRIYTPDAYDASPDQRFPVLYFQDGQNVFDHPASAVFDTWCANRTIERLASEGRSDPWILVAVDHGPDRFTQYSPWPEPRLGVEAGAPAYLDFVVCELMPWVDRTYRTRTGAEQTAIAGSSLGGLVALYAGWRHPEIFGRIGAFSPSVMWSLDALRTAWTDHPRRWSRIYLDVGTLEGLRHGPVEMNYPEAVRSFWEHLVRLGYAEWELRFVIEEGARHEERAWQRRLPEALGWLLGRW